MTNCVEEGNGKQNGRNIHQSSSAVVFYQRTPQSPRRKLPCVNSSLTLVDVTPTAITSTLAPSAILSHASVSTIPAHVTDVTNNGSERKISDGILKIIDMGSPLAATVALSSLCDTIHNALSQAHRSLQEEVAVTGSTNTVSDTSELPFLYLDGLTINDLFRWLQRMRRIVMENFKPSTTSK